MKYPLRHLLVVIPGIGGSRLVDDQGEIWGSLRRMLELVTSPEASYARLALQSGGSTLRSARPASATGLLPDVAVIPGLKKMNGYSATRQWVGRHFELTTGPGANYREFAYDWRLCNRTNARRLGAAVERWLSEFRERSGLPDAKVVILAHSMGGLLSRYWVEKLGGWTECAALITLGTPYRGAVRAVDALVNGFRGAHGVARILRTFPAVHQLLPVYRAIACDDGYRRPAEARLPGIDESMSADALAFHRELEHAAADNAQDERYRRGHVLLPVVGTHQRATLQSAVFDNGRLRCLPTPPTGVVPAQLDDGDGTVPRVSAIPLGGQNILPAYVPQTHGALQLPAVLTSRLLDVLLQLQLPDLREVRGPHDRDTTVAEVGLSLDIDDVYDGTRPVTLRAEAVGCARPPERLAATIAADDGNSRTVLLDKQPGSDHYTGDLRLDAGSYQVTVAAVGGFPTPGPVQDAFVVSDERLDGR